MKLGWLEAATLAAASVASASVSTFITLTIPVAFIVQRLIVVARSGPRILSPILPVSMVDRRWRVGRGLQTRRGIRLQSHSSREG